MTRRAGLKRRRVVWAFSSCHGAVRAYEFFEPTKVSVHLCERPLPFMPNRLSKLVRAAWRLLAIAAAGVTTSAMAAASSELVGIPGVVAAGIRVELIKDGFQGTEGPIALPDGSLLFTEPQANRVNRISAAGEVSVFLNDTNGTNALAFTRSGDLVAVQIGKPRLAVIYPADRVKIQADRFEGLAFFRPNDLVADRKGGIYFTDPSTPPKPETPAPPPPSVYYLTPEQKLLRLTTDITRPNGIQLSPDEKTLYVANTWGEFVLAYDIGADGTISGRRDFAQLVGFQKTETGFTSGADGLAVDASGRLFVATTVGIQVFTSAGVSLGIIPIPLQPQNLAFAGVDKKTLYVVGRGAVYRIPMLTSGFADRAK